MSASIKLHIDDVRIQEIKELVPPAHVLREYPASAVRPDGIGGPSQRRVVFSINLTTTDGLFSAQNFRIQPDDVVLATESAVNDTRTILGLVGTMFGIVNTANDIGN